MHGESRPQLDQANAYALVSFFGEAQAGVRRYGLHRRDRTSLIAFAPMAGFMWHEP